MNDKELIDQLITDKLGLEATDSYIAARWVPQLTRILQKVVGDAWIFDNWPFRGGSATLTVPTTNNGLTLAPVDFMKTGSEGGVFLNNSSGLLTSGEVFFQSQHQFMRYAQQDPTPASLPVYYTLYGLDPTTKRWQMYFYPNLSAAVSVTLLYQKKRPTIIYDTSTTHGISMFPEEFHQEVLVPGCEDLIGVSEGDARTTTELSERFKDALIGMRINLIQGEDAFGQYGENGIGRFNMY